MFGPRLAHRATDEKYEDFFCSRKGPVNRIDLGRKFPIFLKKEIRRFHQVREEYKAKPVLVFCIYFLRLCGYISRHEDSFILSCLSEELV